MRAALGERHHPRLRERRPLALADPGPAEELRVLHGVRDIKARPVDRDHPPAGRAPAVASVPIGLATRANSAAIGSGPSRRPAWKIADFDGRR